MITVETKIKDIKNLPEFKDCKKYLAGSGIIGFVVGQVKIKTFSETWLVEPLAGSFEHMKQLVDDGNKIFYPVYDEAAAAKDKGLKEQVIFHFPVKEKTKIAIIVAGGGYSMVCSFTEGFPIARRMNELGYHAFVVNYRVGKQAVVPNPQDDLAQAIRYIFAQADELNVDPEGYLLGGFSAGGHLAGTMGTKSIGYEHYGLPKPGAMFLAYPVVTMGEKTNAGTRDNHIGKNNTDAAMVQKYSVERNITLDYPPTYVWQCDRDDTVPIENTQMLVAEFEKKGVEHIYKTFNSQKHGWGIATGTAAEGWYDEAVAFWKNVIDA